MKNRARNQTTGTGGHREDSSIDAQERSLAPTTQPEQRRRWSHWHPSTWVFLILYCIPYGTIALPTATFDNKNSSNESVWLHGWPAVHCAQIEYVGFESIKAAKMKLDRKLFNSQDGILFDWQLSSSENDDRLFYWAINAYTHNQTGVRLGVTPQKFWSDSRNWKLWSGQRVSRWFLLGIVINFATFGFFLICAGGSMEWLRRRKKEWYQVTLLEFGLAFVLVGIGLGVALNEHQKVISKTKAMNDFYQASTGQLTGWVDINPPIWFERLTNLSFDMEARGQWVGWVDTRAHNSAIPLPYFAKLDYLDFSRIEDIEKAILAVEGLQPNSLQLNLSRQDNTLELIKRVDPHDIKHLELHIPSEAHGGLDVEEDLLRQFGQLESILLLGDVRLSHVIAARKIPLKILGLAIQVDEAILKEIAKMEGVRSITMTVPERLLPELEQLPRSLQSLDLSITRHSVGSESVVNLGHLPTLVDLEYLSLGIPLATRGNDGNITLGDLGRFTKLRTLKLLPYTGNRHAGGTGYHVGESVVAPTLGEIAMACRPLPSLSTLELGPFTFDEKSSNWIKSHPRLKRLYFHSTVNPEVRAQMRIELPNVEQW